MLFAACGFQDAVPPAARLLCSNDTQCPSALRCVHDHCIDPRAPDAPDLEIDVDEDHAVDVSLVTAQAPSAVVALAAQPGFGTVTLQDGVAHYQPEADFAGVDTFSYTWTIAGAAAGEGVVRVNVAPVNDAPFARVVILQGDTAVAADTLEVPEGGELFFLVDATDAEAPDRRLHFGTVPGYVIDADTDTALCALHLRNVFEDVWELSAADDALCASTPSQQRTLTARDAQGLSAVVTLAMVRVNQNDAPVCGAITSACVGTQTSSGACRTTAHVSVTPSDIDGDAVCVQWSVDAPLASVVAAPCAAQADIVIAGPLASVRVEATACDPQSACTESVQNVAFAGDTSDCAGLKNADPALPSGVYTVDPDSDGGFDAYCEMTTSGGGWTLVLKIDGSQSDFVYNSARWSDASFDDVAISTDGTQAKLRTFLSVPLDEVLMMVSEAGAPAFDSAYAIDVKVAHDHQPVVRPFAASSFQALVTQSEQFVDDDWHRWFGVPGVGFQCGCNRVVANNPRLRFGFLLDEDVTVSGNAEPTCNNPDSYIGIGGLSCFGPVGAAGNCAASNVYDVCEQAATVEAWQPRFIWVFVRSTDFFSTGPAASCAAHAAAGRTLSGRYQLDGGGTVECIFP